MRCPTLRRDSCAAFQLRSFLACKDQQCDSTCQHERTEDWRNGNPIMLFGRGVNRPDIQNFSWWVYVNP
jgi:hypothetical protein